MALSFNDIKRRYYLKKLGLTHSYKSTTLLQRQYWKQILNG